MLQRLYTFKEGTRTFKDVPASHTAYKAVKQLVRSNVTTGYEDNTFRPNVTLTYAHAAAFLARAMKYFSGEKYPLTVKDALQRLYDKGFILEFDHVEDNVYVAHAYTINCDDEICLTATWEWFQINMYDGEITTTTQNSFDEPHEEKYNLTKAQARQILYNEGYITKYAKIVEEEFDSYNYIFTVEDTFDRTTMYIVNPFTSFVDRY